MMIMPSADEEIKIGSSILLLCVRLGHGVPPLCVWLWLVATLSLPLASVGVSHVQYYSLWMAFPKGPHLAKCHIPLEGAIIPAGNFSPYLDLPITLHPASPPHISHHL